MRTTMMMLIACAALAGCGESTKESAARTGEVSLDNASVEEVAEQARAATTAGAMRFDPGEWQTTIEVVKAEIPGMPKAMADQMRQGMMAKTSVTNCMTPEQAAKPNEEVFAGRDKSCRFDRYRMADGTIDATMSCVTVEGSDARTVISMKGTYDRTSFALENSMTAAPVPGHPEIAMTARVTGKRLGACKG